MGRAAVANALGEFFIAEPPEALRHAPAIAELLNDVHWSVRVNAAHALGGLSHGNEYYETQLRRATRDSNRRVREAATHALSDALRFAECTRFMGRLYCTVDGDGTPPVHPSPS